MGYSPSALKLVSQVAVPPLTVWLPPEQLIGELLEVKLTVPPLIPLPPVVTVAVSVVVLFGDAVYDGFTLELTVVVVEGKLE
jgi:hypothetical protein